MTLSLEKDSSRELVTSLVEHLVERWARKYGDRITGYFRRPAQPAVYADFPPELSADLREAL